MADVRGPVWPWTMVGRVAVLAPLLTLLAGAAGCANKSPAPAKPQPQAPVGERDINAILLHVGRGATAVDVDRDGRGDVLMIGLYLFSQKTQRSAIGDGEIIIRLYQYRPGPSGSAQLTEVHSWTIDREDGRRSLYRVTTGYQYRLGLLLPLELQLFGPAEIQAEFHGADGTVLAGKRKRVQLTPDASGLPVVRSETTTLGLQPTPVPTRARDER